MSMINHVAGVLMAMGGGGVQAFSPTISGRESASGHLVIALGFASTIAPTTANAEADTDIWVEVTTGQATIYCGGTNADYYDETGTNLGDPGSRAAGGTAIFTLGVEPDEIKVEKSGESTSSSSGGSASVTQIGTFTDGAFFSPTASTDYGYQTDTSATDTTDDSTSEVADATVTVTFTFRKAGYEDYSISFSQDAGCTANQGTF